MAWEAIGDRLGISDDQARSWYMRWSPNVEADYQDRYARAVIEVTLSPDDLSIGGDPELFDAEDVSDVTNEPK